MAITPNIRWQSTVNRRINYQRQKIQENPSFGNVAVIRSDQELIEFIFEYAEEFFQLVAPLVFSE